MLVLGLGLFGLLALALLLLGLSGGVDAPVGGDDTSSDGAENDAGPEGSAGIEVMGAGDLTGALLADLSVSELQKPRGGAWNADYIQLRKSSVGTFQGEPVVRVVYERGSGTGSRKGSGGAAISGAPRGLPGDAAVFAYDVYFEKGFQFSLGGKMCGLSIGHGSASGLRHSPSGASHRVVWRKGGGASSYIYPPSGVPQEDPRLKASGAGINYFYETVFKPGTLRVGQWNHVEVGVRLNTFDAAGRPRPDGVAYLHINGRSASVNNIRWVPSPSLKITSCYLSTFFGGTWVAPNDCVAYYKNFKLFAMK